MAKLECYSMVTTVNEYFNLILSSLCVGVIGICRNIVLPATISAFNPFSAGIDFRRQNLTSVDVRF